MVPLIHNLTNMSERISERINDPAEAEATAYGERQVRDSIYNLKNKGLLSPDDEKALIRFAAEDGLSARREYLSGLPFEEKLRRDPITRALLRIDETKFPRRKQYIDECVKIDPSYDPRFLVVTARDCATHLEPVNFKIMYHNLEFWDGSWHIGGIDRNMLYWFVVKYLDPKSEHHFSDQEIQILKEEGVPVDDLIKQAQELDPDEKWFKRQEFEKQEWTKKIWKNKSSHEPRREKEGYKNWHLTETETGAWSTGVADSEPGHNPANQEEGTAESWVAPGDFVEEHVKKNNDGQFTDQAVREALRAWAREQK